MRSRVLVLALAAASASCAAGVPPYMQPLTAPAAATVRATDATIVFVRPADTEGSVQHVIVDERGAFVGTCRGQTQFAVDVPPGEHVFMSFPVGATFGDAANLRTGTPALRATVEAGRVYYVYVVAVAGSWTTRARMFAMGPTREHWSELPEWLGRSQALVPDRAAGQAHLAEVLRVANPVEKGLHHLTEYTAEELAQRTLLPTDGVAIPVPPRARAEANPR